MLVLTFLVSEMPHTLPLFSPKNSPHKLVIRGIGLVVKRWAPLGAEKRTSIGRPWSSSFGGLCRIWGGSPSFWGKGSAKKVQISEDQTMSKKSPLEPLKDKTWVYLGEFSRVMGRDRWIDHKICSFIGDVHFCQDRWDTNMAWALLNYWEAKHLELVVFRIIYHWVTVTGYMSSSVLTVRPFELTCWRANDLWSILKSPFYLFSHSLIMPNVFILQLYCIWSTMKSSRVAHW